jgi:non-ribosomal peptide synthetase component F
LLRSALSNPEATISELEVLGDEERRLVLQAWNDTRTEYRRDASIHRLFEEQVRRTPAALAVIYEQERVSYEELNKRANRMAHYLRSLGVGPEALVALLLERSVEMVVAVLGILKAGGAYLPLDPEWPRQRVGEILKDAQVSVVVTQQSVVEKFGEFEAQLVCVDGNAEEVG